MKIHIASDHAGFEMKKALVEALVEHAFDVVDHGANSFSADDDYPDFTTPCAKAVAADPESKGIIVGGTGQGEMMCANKVKGIRCALFYGPETPKYAVDITGKESTDAYEIVNLARTHNNANMLSLSSRFLRGEEAMKAVMLFLETQFSNEERHVRRLSKF